MKDKITIGAIRWDAWYKEFEENGVSFQVQRSLSPSYYHFRAPFHARVTGDNRITIPAYTQAEFDKEAAWAIDAGIDYFAYVWYNQPGLRIARELHLTSHYRNDIRFCVCLDGNGTANPEARAEITALLGDPCYKTVAGGRPLFYYFCTEENQDNIKSDIAFYKDYCKKNGLPAPYAVAMRFGGERSKALGADAISRYTYEVQDGITYKALTEYAAEKWQTDALDARKIGLGYIPTLSAGWHALPREENRVKWMDYDLSHEYAQYAEPQEIYHHFKAVIRYLEENATSPENQANTAILYAWNEHDEGGWICPTITVDDKGAMITDKNGNPIPNTDRIEAVKKAIKG